MRRERDSLPVAVSKAVIRVIALLLCSAAAAAAAWPAGGSTGRDRVGRRRIVVGDPSSGISWEKWRVQRGEEF